jgi:hypothetical protein
MAMFAFNSSPPLVFSDPMPINGRRRESGPGFGRVCPGLSLRLIFPSLQGSGGVFSCQSPSPLPDEEEVYDRDPERDMPSPPTPSRPWRFPFYSPCFPVVIPC